MRRKRRKRRKRRRRWSRVRIGVFERSSFATRRSVEKNPLDVFQRLATPHLQRWRECLSFKWQPVLASAAKAP